MLKGIDISAFQSVNAVDLADDFVIIKATQGTSYVSNLCDPQYQRAKQLGKKRGVYHYASGGDPIAEANFFINNIKGYIGDAILILDWEQYQNSRFGEHAAWVKKFADRVYELTGVWVMVYMSAYVLKLADWSSVAKNCGLWIAGYPARYDVSNPPTPSVNDMPYNIGVWAFWAIWQYTSSAGKLDRDIANMTREAWDKYAAPSGSKPTPAPTPTPQPAKKTVDQLAQEVIRGDWGNGYERKSRLKKAGYDYDAVQKRVDEILGANKKTYYTVKPGDNLSSIAAKYGTTWQAIYDKNKGIIGSNPNIIKPGQRLEI